MSKDYWVYILASRRNGTLYIGVTGSLTHRIAQHREGSTEGFADHKLVHIEQFGDISEAIAREKALKKWNRDWKLRLIERDNPDWNDLWDSING